MGHLALRAVSKIWVFCVSGEFGAAVDAALVLVKGHNTNDLDIVNPGVRWGGHAGFRIVIWSFVGDVRDVFSGNNVRVTIFF